MKRGKIIVIEGPSNTGKTTTCQNMKKYDDCVVIDECMVYEANSPEPSRNLEEEISNQLFFFNVERRRMQKAKMYALNGKNVILDRCALSTVAIAYAFEKMGKYKTFLHALKQYESLIKDTELINPDEYIFLHTDFNSTKKRNKARANELSDEWIDDLFTKYQNEFYKIVYEKIPISQRICTTGKDKEFVSRILAGTLNLRELDEKDI